MDRTARPDAGHPDVPPPPGTDADQSESAGQRWAVPWGLLDCVGVLLLAVVATVALVLLVGAVVPPEPPTWLEGLLLSLPLAVLGLVTLVWVRIRFGTIRPLRGPGSASARDWLVAAGWGVAVFVAVNIVFALLVQLIATVAGFELPEPQEELRRTAIDPAMAPWFLLSAVIVAPLAEELYFRGMLFQALRRRSGPWLAISVSAMVFAAAHVLQEGAAPAGVLAFVMILPAGFFLGWVFERHKNLAVPIVVHLVFNLATTLLLILGAAAGVFALG